MENKGNGDENIMNVFKPTCNCRPSRFTIQVRSVSLEPLTT
ncbi:hypothetical protein PAT3040_02139 [Paenibacillus agaridevorans]|uniref:Uncharacterized protein n=1 Tax=Paenibacillus agaridevorans TaxID=171404 RepID=A0A2R5EUW7_9BACL|nr:hypothetical protein PAT3040_02139 [Paenibacillus agaridevorans]